MKHLVSKKAHRKRHVLLVTIIGSLGLLLYAFSVVYPTTKHTAAVVVKTRPAILGELTQKKTTPIEALSIPVLLYHGIVDTDDGVNTHYENFVEQMKLLWKEGYYTIDTAQLKSYLDGTLQLTGKPIMITFDDGRRDSYYQTDEVFKALNYKAVMFAITGRSLVEHPSTFHLNSSELKRMSDSGRWDIQSHGDLDHDDEIIAADGTKGHFLTNALYVNGSLESHSEYLSRITNDLTISKEKLSSLLPETKQIAFAYPFGDYGTTESNVPNDDTILRPLVRSIYPLSFYQAWTATSKQNHPEPETTSHEVKRIIVKKDWSPTHLLQVLTTSTEKSLPYYDYFQSNKGWEATWGQLEISSAGLTLASNKSGALALLDGTHSFANYKFNTQVSTTNNEPLSIIFGYEDGKNYSGCTFSGSYSSMFEYVKGVRRTIQSVAYSQSLKQQLIGVIVQQGVASCVVANKVIVTATFQPPLSGMIGFQTSSGNAPIIHSVEIEKFQPIPESITIDDASNKTARTLAFEVIKKYTDSTAGNFDAKQLTSTIPKVQAYITNNKKQVPVSDKFTIDTKILFNLFHN